MQIVGCISGKGDVLYHIEQCNAYADLIEFRLDLFSRKDYLDLFPLCTKPIIATVRHKDHGGWFSGEEEARIATLKEAIAHGAQYVDLEGEFFTRLDAKMIASYHNFDEVPENVQDIIDELSQLPCDVVKIAVRAKDNDLNALHSLRCNKSLACFSMPHKESRLASHNALVYCAPEEGEHLVQGQPTVEEARELLG